MRHRGRGGDRRSRMRHRSRSRRRRGLHDLGLLARLVLDLVDRKRRRGRHLGSEARSTGSMEKRRLLLGHRLHRGGFLLRLGALLALVGLAGLGGRGRLGRGPRALLLLGGDPGRERLLLQLALGLVFFAAVDPLLPRREGVDLEGPLQLVRAVLVDRAGGGLDVHPQLLEAVDHLLAREVEVPRELEDPNVPHPAPLPDPSPRPRLRRRAPARFPPPSRLRSSSTTRCMRAISASTSWRFSSSLLMSMRQPTSLAAKRTFWPFLPMARESCLSSTTTSMIFCSSSTIVTRLILAGESAFSTKTTGSSFHSTMSIFSPRSSRMMDCTRVPFMPTHAPTGSTSFSRETTATLARSPASRTQPLIWTVVS